MKLSDIKPNPNNPRVIKDDAFEKLCNSIKEFPKMMALRPMVVDQDNVVLGGNMRLKALQHLGFKEIPDTWVRKASELTDEEKRRFIIADNVSGGDWDWGVLQADWDLGELEDWGLEVPIDKIKDASEIPGNGELEFSDELLLEHNYIVLYFDNALDWEVAQEKFGVKKVKDLIPRKGQPNGVGRVVNGKMFL